MPHSGACLEMNRRRRSRSNSMPFITGSRQNDARPGDAAPFRASLVVVHYAQHRRPFLAGALTPALVLDLNEEGTSRLRASG